MQTARATRARREKLQLVLLATASVATVAVIALLPDDSALMGVAVLAFPITIIGSSLTVERDEWHRSRAVQGVAVAFAAAVATQVVEAVWVSVDPVHRPAPGRALAIVTFVWLVADFVLRQRADTES